MKYMRVLDTITLKNVFGKVVSAEDEDGNKTDAALSFKDFVLGRLLDAKFSKDVEGVMSAMQIKQAVDQADKVLALETSDWTKLLDAVKNPSGGYNPAIAISLVPFMKEIINASDEEPTNN